MDQLPIVDTYSINVALLPNTQGVTQMAKNTQTTAAAPAPTTRSSKTATTATTAPAATAERTPQPTLAATATATATNHTLTYRRTHPNDRCSYGIAGVPGIVVFDVKLFADGKPPKTIVLDCALALPVGKVDKKKPAAA